MTGEHLQGTASALAARLRTAELMAPALVALATYCVLSQVIALPYPFVFADEFSYAFRTKYGWSSFAGQEGILAPALPNLLYLSLFGYAHAFGDGALAAARALNACFYGLAAFPLYWLCRRVMGAGAAAVLALLFCVGPTGSYAAYFMPEATYFLCFWLVILAFVRFIERSTLARLAAMAALLAALTLVKPHAIVLVACFAGVLPASALVQPKGVSVWRLLLLAVMLVVLWYCAWVCLAWVLAGELLVNPVGSLYGGMAKHALSSAGGQAALLPRLAKVGVRHLAVLVMLFGVPMFLTVSQLFRARAQRREGAPGAAGGALALASLAILGALVLMTTKFTVDVAGTGPYESLDRLHGRYYSFALPLLVISGAAAASFQRLRDRGWMGRMILGAAALTLAGGWWVLHRAPAPSWNDFPEGFSLLHGRSLFALALIANAAAAVLAFQAPAWVWRTFLAFFAIFSVAGALEIFGEQRAFSASDEDRAGLAVRAMLSEAQRGSVVVFSRTRDASPYRFGFYLLSPARFRLTGDAPRVECATLPPEAQSVVTLDPVEVGCGFVQALSIGKVTLFRRPEPPPAAAGPEGLQLWFDRERGAASSTSGFHAPEAWGRWSATANPGVTLPATVEGCVDLVVKGQAFGPNAGRALRVRLGDQEAAMTFSGEPREVTARYRLSEPTRSLGFSGLTPVSPAEAGQGEDVRPLGLGLVEVRLNACASGEPRPGEDR